MDPRLEINMANDGANSFEFSVKYNAKDVILYALSVGYGSTARSYEKDLRFLYEEHNEFRAVPTVCLSLIFRATEKDSVGTTCAMPAFPPPMMESMGILPRKFLRSNVPIVDYPIVHAAQSIVWSYDMPTPTLERPTIRMSLRGRFVSVTPKSIGTFVTTETEMYDCASSRLTCLIRSTALVLGLSPELVIPFSSPSTLSVQPFAPSRVRQLLLEADYDIGSQTALLYRLASGDANRIHVHAHAVPFGDKDQDKEPRPILHGLCTLGIAVRIIMQHVCERQGEVIIQYLEAKFASPVFIDDLITVQAWKVLGCSGDRMDTMDIAFVVRRKTSGENLVDNGSVRLKPASIERTPFSRL
jgi:acyl dehydratase